MLDNYMTLAEGNLQVRYVEGDERFANETLRKLMESFALLSEYFRLEESSLQGVRAILVPNRSEYDRLVVGLLGVDIEVPSNPGRVAQPQRTDIVFLSASAYRQHSTYYYDAAEYRRLVVHELVHVFEEHLSPDIEASPRWWSEGLAAYLSGQWKHADQFRFRQPAMDGIRLGSVPSIQEIQADVGLCYDWGWTIVMFIEHTYGRDTIGKVVRECREGNVLATLGDDPVAFEKRWREWLPKENRRF